MINREISSSYRARIKKRGIFRYFFGLIPRGINFIKNSYSVRLARYKGAVIGSCVSIPYGLAKKANINLRIGSHSSIQSCNLDLRSLVNIGDHVIIGENVTILTVSHDIDSPEWGNKYYGLTIEDYCWLATNSFVLPSCRRIERGAVCAAGSVIARNVSGMDVVGGNPAVLLRKRKCVHTDLCVESLLGNDLLAYINSRKSDAGKIVCE